MVYFKQMVNQNNVFRFEMITIKWSNFQPYKKKAQVQKIISKPTIVEKITDVVAQAQNFYLQ